MEIGHSVNFLEGVGWRRAHIWDPSGVLGRVVGLLRGLEEIFIPSIGHKSDPFLSRLLDL